MSDKQQKAPANGSSDKAEKSDKAKKLIQCGSCTYLIRDRVFEAKCSDLGRLPTSKSCGSYSPDVFSLVGSEENNQNLESVADMMSQMSPNDLQILGAMMLREKQTRKHGFKFHQKVYVRFRGNSSANYLSNFVVGYVLDANKDTIRVVGESGATAISAINDKDSETVYTVARFNKMRIEMVAERRLIDPAIKEEEARIKSKMYSGIMPLDQAVADGIIDKKAMKNKAAKDDLVSLVARMGRGQLRRKKEKAEAIGNDEVKINWD